uniref:Uncharacterized protein n=1 Tax=Lotharella oceanica TaxID=641309 RepID=A0A7S2TF21_9EUKA|mmetsp:Transcript_10981/g.21020  ORF Transcript_10981/g.21020 Transcript_10981/m.21020 type:complete len:327 (+) Transcript_10981:87-1067(+)
MGSIDKDHRQILYTDDLEEEEKGKVLSWRDSVLESEFAESAPVLMCGLASITMAITFAVFYGTGMTTKKVCEIAKLGNCDKIDDWQFIPTISFTFVDWPGYGVSLVGMLSSAILLWVSSELEYHILETQMRKLNMRPNQRISGWCCCCCTLSCAVGFARLVGHVICVSFAVCMICQLRFNIYVHAMAAFVLFVGGLIMILIHQQIQYTLLDAAMARQDDQEISQNWAADAATAMRFKRYALLSYLACGVAYAIAIQFRRREVEPYSATTEYAVVLSLAVGVASYAADIRMHKKYFSCGTSRLAIVDDYRGSHDRLSSDMTGWTMEE